MDPIVQRKDGEAPGVMRQLYRRDDYEAVGRGMYVPKQLYKSLDAVDKHMLLIEAVVPGLASDCVLSHQSAAVMLDLPLWSADTTLVHVTRNRRSGGRIKSLVQVHCSDFDENATTVCGKFTVMGLARTVIDLARTLSYESAVVVIEHVLNQGELTAGDLDEELLRAKRSLGISKARCALGFAGDKSESVGESISRLVFAELPVPMPQQQGDVHDHVGRFLGRADFFWEKHSVLGEFDGMTKYQKLLKVGQSASEAVVAEKRREDSMREAGFHVFRWTSEELVDRVEFQARVERALLLGSRLPRPAGSIHPGSVQK